MAIQKPQAPSPAVRTDIIQTVKTPLGFFTLVVLVVEVILGITANFSQGADRTYLIVGMLSLIFLLVIIVAGFAFFRPEALSGERPPSFEQSVPRQVDSPGTPSDMPASVQKVRSLYLIHRVSEWRKDADGITRRGIYVRLQTYPEEVANKVKKVIYYLPNSWPEDLRVRPTENREKSFPLNTRAYGEFTVGVEVYLEGEKEPVIINRYINFGSVSDDTDNE